MAQEARRRGIARELLKETASAFSTLPRLRLQVKVNNARARLLYESLEFDAWTAPTHASDPFSGVRPDHPRTHMFMAAKPYDILRATEVSGPRRLPWGCLWIGAHRRVDGLGLDWRLDDVHEEEERLCTIQKSPAQCRRTSGLWGPSVRLYLNIGAARGC